jgi:hypothetical protein
MLPKVLIIKNFISQEICDSLNIWVDEGVKNKWLDFGINKGSGWGYKKRFTTRNYADRFEYPEIAYTTFDKITKHFGYEDVLKSVSGGGKDGIVVSCTFPEGDVYEHIDPKETALGSLKDVLRCNILTRKADVGGILHVDGEQIDLDVGDLHCYVASAFPHYVTEVQGSTSRVLWMFGYQV